MSKDKILNLREWDIATVADETLATISMHFSYPATATLQGIAPQERAAAIDEQMRGYSASVVHTGLLQTHSVIMERHRPRGLRAEVPLRYLAALCQLPGVDRIAITKVAGLKKKRQRPSAKRRFHCVRMTVAIQIEGAQKGLQKYEERYVLIRATCCEDAYQRVEATREEYAKPYLNSDGYLVRWQVESLDDCYETGIEAVAAFNSPQGIEVFSSLKSRKLTAERAWDGK